MYFARSCVEIHITTTYWCEIILGEELSYFDAVTFSQDSSATVLLILGNHYRGVSKARNMPAWL